MCCHCEKLKEDKQAIHDFVALTCKRLSEIHGMTIEPEWIEMRVELTLPPPTTSEEASARLDAARSRIHRMLAEFNA